MVSAFSQPACAADIAGMEAGEGGAKTRVAPSRSLVLTVAAALAAFAVALIANGYRERAEERNNRAAERAAWPKPVLVTPGLLPRLRSPRGMMMDASCAKGFDHAMCFYRSSPAFFDRSVSRDEQAARVIVARVGLQVKPSDVRCPLLRPFPRRGLTLLICNAVAVLDTDFLNVHLKTAVYARGRVPPRNGFRPGTELRVDDLGRGYSAIPAPQGQLWLTAP